MTSATHPPTPAHSIEKAIALALRLAHAENALHALTLGQVDAIVDPDGRAYLLRPAQEHLRANERRLQTVIESTADVITVVGRGGLILSQSHAVRRVLGYEPEELVGSSIFALIHGEDLDRLYTAFFNVVEGFQETATAQFHHPLRDGSYLLIEATVGKLRDGSSASAVLSMRPIANPSRKRLEPAWVKGSDAPLADKYRDCIMLSHGRRIPLAQAPLGEDFHEPTLG